MHNKRPHLSSAAAPSNSISCLLLGLTAGIVPSSTVLNLTNLCWEWKVGSLGPSGTQEQSLGRRVRGNKSPEAEAFWRLRNTVLYIICSYKALSYATYISVMEFDYHSRHLYTYGRDMTAKFSDCKARLYASVRVQIRTIFRIWCHKLQSKVGTLGDFVPQKLKRFNACQTLFCT